MLLLVTTYTTAENNYVIFVKDANYLLQAVLETVAKITHDKSKKNDTQEAKYGNVKLTCFSTISVCDELFILKSYFILLCCFRSVVLFT